MISLIGLPKFMQALVLQLTHTKSLDIESARSRGLRIRLCTADLSQKVLCRARTETCWASPLPQIVDRQVVFLEL